MSLAEVKMQSSGFHSKNMLSSRRDCAAGSMRIGTRLRQAYGRAERADENATLLPVTSTASLHVENKIKAGRVREMP